jgi:hypothetical protein
MTETKSPADIAQACRVAADDLLDIATDLDYYLLQADRAKYIVSMSALLMMYAKDIEGKKP